MNSLIGACAQEAQRATGESIKMIFYFGNHIAVDFEGEVKCECIYPVVLNTWQVAGKDGTKENRFGLTVNFKLDRFVSELNKYHSTTGRDFFHLDVDLTKPKKP